MAGVAEALRKLGERFRRIDGKDEFAARHLRSAQCEAARTLWRGERSGELDLTSLLGCQIDWPERSSNKGPDYELARWCSAWHALLKVLERVAEEHTPINASALIPSGKGSSIGVVLGTWREQAHNSAIVCEYLAGLIDEASPAEATSKTKTPTKAKRSTERGEGRAKLIAALTKHHKHADGSCLNLEPVGNNELARLAEVSESTASAFFNKQFGGHTKYRAICSDKTTLISALKLLNQEFAPHHLYGAKPPGEHERADED